MLGHGQTQPQGLANAARRQDTQGSCFQTLRAEHLQEGERGPDTSWSSRTVAAASSLPPGPAPAGQGAPQRAPAGPGWARAAAGLGTALADQVPRKYLGAGSQEPPLGAPLAFSASSAGYLISDEINDPELAAGGTHAGACARGGRVSKPSATEEFGARSRSPDLQRQRGRERERRAAPGGRQLTGAATVGLPRAAGLSLSTFQSCAPEPAPRPQGLGSGAPERAVLAG